MKKVYFILALIILATIVANIFWISLDQSPPLWDMAAHSARAADFARLILHFDFAGILAYETIYPPLTYLVTGFLFIISGFNQDVPQFSILIYVLILLLSVFSLAKILLKNEYLALLAVFLTALYPELAHFSRVYDLDYQLTALVSFSLLALIKSENFKNKKWSMIFGLALGLGILTKWTIALYVLGPFIFCVILLIKDFKTGLKNQFINLAWAAGIVFLLSVPWYALHAIAVLKSSLATRNNIFSVPYENLFSPGNIGYYFWYTLRGMAWPMAIFAVIGIIFSMYKRKFSSWFLLSWILVPYLLMTFLLYSKESRYFLPVYPALAIVSVYFLTIFKKNYPKYILAGLMIFLGLIFWTETSWNVRLFPANLYSALGRQNQYGYQQLTYEKVGFGFTYPTVYQTEIKKIPLKILELEQGKNREEKIKIVVVPNSIFLTAAQIQYYGNLAGLEADYSLSSKIRSQDYAQYLGQADYIITKTGEQGPKIWAPYLEQIAVEEKNPQAEIFKAFILADSWQLQGIETEMQTARLYEKR